MYCVNCGHDMSSNKFCANCGAPTVETPKVTEPTSEVSPPSHLRPPNARAGLPKSTIALIALIVISVLALVLFLFRDFGKRAVVAEPDSISCVTTANSSIDIYKDYAGIVDKTQISTVVETGFAVANWCNKPVVMLEGRESVQDLSGREIFWANFVSNQKIEVNERTTTRGSQYSFTEADSDFKEIESLNPEDVRSFIALTKIVFEDGSFVTSSGGQAASESNSSICERHGEVLADYYYDFGFGTPNPTKYSQALERLANTADGELLEAIRFDIENVPDNPLKLPDQFKTADLCERLGLYKPE
jgi:hypothetical protein